MSRSNISTLRRSVAEVTAAILADPANAGLAPAAFRDVLSAAANRAIRAENFERGKGAQKMALIGALTVAQRTSVSLTQASSGGSGRWSRDDPRRRPSFRITLMA